MQLERTEAERRQRVALLPPPLHVNMAFVVVSLALVLTPWTTATPVHNPIVVNSTDGHVNRTKRWCPNQVSGDASQYTWAWCNNYYWDCYNPCPVGPTAWPTAPPHTHPPTEPTHPWTTWPTAPTQATTPPYTPIWPTWTPRPTRPPYTPIWPTWTPRPTRPPYTPTWPTWIPTWPPYTPIWPTVSPRPTRPPYTPIWPTVSPRPPYTPIMPTVSPRPTRPPYTPIWPTVSPRPTRPPYTPIMPTVSPRPPYTPIMPTVSPRPTRPPYTPIWPTVSPRPPYTPIMPTVSPRPTRPPYTPIMPTVSPRPTRPPYTPIMPTVSPRPTRPPYTPIWPTVSPRPPYTPIMPTVSPRPPYTPIMPTVSPRPTRPPYTPIIPTVSPWPPFTPITLTWTPYPTYPTVTNARRQRCNKVCVDENKMYYCCDTTTTHAPTTAAARVSTCPAQTSPCPKAANHTTQRECMFDYQCQDEHGCCYDSCLQEYRCVRLQPRASSSLALRSSPSHQHYHHHHYEDETRVERSLQDEGKRRPAAAPRTHPAHDAKVLMEAITLDRRRQRRGSEQVAVLVDERRRGSAQHLHRLLEPLSRLQHPSPSVMFLPLHPPQRHRKAVWEAVQCAASIVPQQGRALQLVACVLASTTPHPPRLHSLSPSIRRCALEQHVSWESLKGCVKRGEGGSMLRGALLRHRPLLQAARKHQLTAQQPAASVLAINGTVVEEAVAAISATAVAISAAAQQVTTGQPREPPLSTSHNHAYH